MTDNTEWIAENWIRQRSACANCPLHPNERGNREKPVFRIGSIPADVAIVGQDPGDQAGQQERPAPDERTVEEIRSDIESSGPYRYDQDGTGTSGHLVSLVDGLHDQDYSVYFTDAVKCQGMANPSPDGEPSASECCSPYLVPELSAVNPEVIVTAGQPATDTVYSLYGVYNMYGDKIETRADGEVSIMEERGAERQIDEFTILPIKHWQWEKRETIEAIPERVKSFSKGY